MRKAGRVLHPDDACPALDWEVAIWRLWQLVRTQWRAGVGGLIGLDYNPAIALIERWRWPVDTSLELLHEIEETFMIEAQKKAEAERRSR